MGKTLGKTIKKGNEGAGSLKQAKKVEEPASKQKENVFMSSALVAVIRSRTKPNSSEIIMLDMDQVTTIPLGEMATTEEKVFAYLFGKIYMFKKSTEDKTSQFFVWDVKTGTGMDVDLPNTVEYMSGCRLCVSACEILFSGGSEKCSVFNPATNLCTTLPNLRTSITDHACVWLKDGQILLIGGYQNRHLQAVALLPRSYTSVESAEASTPVDWRFIRAMRYPRSKHVATVIEDGRVVVAGGIRNQSEVVESIEIFSPPSPSETDGLGQWTLLSKIINKLNVVAVIWISNKLFIFQEDYTACSVLSNTEKGQKSENTDFSNWKWTLILPTEKNLNYQFVSLA